VYLTQGGEIEATSPPNVGYAPFTIMRSLLVLIAAESDIKTQHSQQSFRSR